MLFTGQCHCGNLQARFESGFSAAQLPLRACQCSFCRAHGTVSAADPYGRLTLTASAPDQVRHYRFGLGITDFLICTRCGVYVAAVMEIDGRSFASLNTKVLRQRAELAQPPQPLKYDGETAEQRRVRRQRNWTPTELHLGAG
jgi:hypothetical protein